MTIDILSVVLVYACTHDTNVSYFLFHLYFKDPAISKTCYSQSWLSFFFFLPSVVTFSINDFSLVGEPGSFLGVVDDILFPHVSSKHSHTVRSTCTDNNLFRVFHSAVSIVVTPVPVAQSHVSMCLFYKLLCRSKEAKNKLVNLLSLLW